jgi:hypothetical protein
MPPRADFDRFCQATHTWLAESSSLDPALAAAADLLERGLTELTAEVEDAHALLGLHALQALLDLAGQCDRDEV